MSTQRPKTVKCKICEKKFVGKQALIDHIERQHSSSIPEGYTAARYENFLRTGKTEGRCVQCHKPTTWNPATGKYNRMCGRPECKEKAYQLAQKNYIGKHGKQYSINNPEQQKKMVYGRKNSGKYVFVNEETGQKYEAMYDSSYGKEFLEMIDTFLGWSGEDVIAPSPHTYYYKYEGKEHFYIPDVYLPSINLEVELKDGGDNPNMHPKIQAVDKVKEKLKDEVMDSIKNEVNYIKICNKDYSEFFALLSRLREADNCPLPKWESRLERTLEAAGVNVDIPIHEGVDPLNLKMNLIKRNKMLKDPLLNYNDLLLYYRKRLFHDNLNKVQWVMLQNELEDVQEYLKAVINSNTDNNQRMNYEAKKALKEVNRFLEYMNNGGYPAFEATIEDQKMFHISEKNLDGHTLRPSVPSNFMTNHGYEDNKTKRVCFCPTVDDCITALSQNCAGKTYYVHEPDGQYIYHDTQNADPKKSRYVPDCHITREKWIEEPVKLKKVGIIHVISVKHDEGTIYEYGEDKVAKLYRWVYEWEEQIQEAVTESMGAIFNLYHGSHSDINGNKLVPANKSHEDDNYVFGTPDRNFALCYAGNPWHDGMMNQSYYNGQLTLTEKQPGVFKKVFNTSGYIYTISDPDVNRFDSRTPHVFLSKNEVSISGKEKIQNVWNEIKNSDIELYTYPNKPDWWNSKHDRTIIESVTESVVAPGKEYEYEQFACYYLSDDATLDKLDSSMMYGSLTDAIDKETKEIVDNRDSVKLTKHVYTLGKADYPIYLGEIEIRTVGPLGGVVYDWISTRGINRAMVDSGVEVVIDSVKDPARPVIHKPDLTEAGEELDYHNIPDQMTESVLTEGFKPNGHKNLDDFFMVSSDSAVVKKMVDAGIDELKFVALSDDGSVWLDRRKNKLVAMVAIDKSQHPYWIYDLVVGEDYRGYGLGNQVLDYAVTKLGGEALTVNKNNDIAIHMYKKYGFVEKKVSGGKPGMVYMYLEGQPTMELSMSSTMVKDFQAKGSRQLSEFTKMTINKTTVDKYKVRYPHLKHIRVEGANGYLWFEQNELVAYVAVDFGGSKKWIQALYVAPDYRGYGLSKQLLKIAENELNATHLSVRKDNEVAVNLYKKNGWKEDTSIDPSEHMIFMTNGREKHLPVTEGHVLNDEDIYHNKEAFENGDINICFITGLSGSGKTTMASGITKDFYQLDDLLIQQNFSDENLKEYGPVISGYFKGPGKEFRKLKSAEEYTEEIERNLIRGFVSYAIKYASSHKKEKVIIEGVELYWVYEPSELKDYAVYIKGTSSLLSQIRSAVRDSSDAKGRIGRFFAFLQIMTHKGRVSAYADSEKKIKRWREYFSKESVSEATIISNDNGCRIYACFAGVGKNAAIQRLMENGYKVDSIEKEFGFNKEMFAKQIKELATKNDILFIPYYLGMERNDLKGQIDYTLVYPDRSLRSTYLERYADIDFTEEQIKNFSDNWNAMIADCERSRCRKIRLTSKDDFILPYIEEDLGVALQEASYIEATKEENHYFPVFIFLSYTGSSMAKLIKAFTHDPYAHSSISFDTNLDNMISFNTEGMVTEDIRKKLYKKNEANIRYSLYMYMASAQEYDTMKGFVDNLLSRKDKLKYNMLGLTNFIFGRGSEREDMFFCSEFVASVIGAGNSTLIKTKPYMTSPYNLAKNKNFIFVKTGILKNYDTNVIDKIVGEKLEERGFQDVIIK